MVSLSFLVFLVAVAVAGVHAQTINVTTSSTDYYLFAQRELLQDCDVAQVQIDAVNARYADELSVIKLQQGNVLNEIQAVNKTYTSQQALNVNKKHCIQNNALLFVNYNSANTRLSACYNTAASLASTLTRTANTDLASARSGVLVNLPKAIKACDVAYPSNQVQLDDCYVKEVTKATTTCNTYLDRVQTDLNKSVYDASVATNTAVKCSFAVEKDVLVSMGQAQEVIANCEQALGAPKSASLQLIAPKMTAPQLSVSLKKLIGL